MLFNIICVKTASNCFAASLSPCCGFAPACARSASKPCVSSAKRFDRLEKPLVVSVDANAVLAMPVVFEFMRFRSLDDFEVCAQRARGLHRLKDRDEIRRRRAERV